MFASEVTLAGSGAFVANELFTSLLELEEVLDELLSVPPVKGEALAVAVGLESTLGEELGSTLGDGDGDGAGLEPFCVLFGLGDGLGLGDDVGVGVGVGDGDGLADRLGEGVGVGVGDAQTFLTFTLASSISFPGLGLRLLTAEVA